MARLLEKINFILKKQEKKKLIILFIGMILLALLETFSIGVIIPIMDLFVNPAKIQTSKILNWFYQLIRVKDNISFLTFLILGAIVLFVFKAIYTVFMLFKQRSVTNDIRVRLTTGLLASYLNKPYPFHLENNSSILFKNITAEVNQFCDSFLYSVILVSAEIIILLAISSLLIYLYPTETLLLFTIFLVVMALINILLRKRIKEYSLERNESSGQVYKFGLEALQAVKEIKIYNAHDFFIGKYAWAAKRYGTSYLKFTVVSDFPRYILEVLLWTSLLMALLFSIYFHKSTSDLIPMMTAFGLAAIRMLPSINRVYLNINVIKYYSNGIDIIYKIVNEADVKALSEKNITTGPSIPSEPQDLILENIQFQYKTAASPIFEGFNLIIPKHKTIALVGKTGAGKSTLIDILMGLLTTADGILYYGGVPVTTENISEYRRKISYVPQHTFLIDDTLEANIAFGIPGKKIDYKQLKRVINISQLESLVDNLPEGTKTLVGERGVRLSGGQRQRVAIARALYRNPEILIMDEATSALDGHTEFEVNKAIKNLCGKLTIIIIAHRLSTVECADIIYVMDQGKIVDKGNFKELLENSAIFRKIANKIPA